MNRLGLWISVFVLAACEPEQPPIGQFVDCEGLTIDSEDRIIVSDEDGATIQIFSPEGERLARWGEHGLEEGKFLGNLDGITVGSDGRITVIDGRGHRMMQFDREGKYLQTVGKKGTAEGEFNDPEGITQAADGTVYVTDEDNRRIQVFDADLKFLRAFPVPADPEGIAIHPKTGQLHITFSKDDVVGIYDTEGKRLGSYGEDDLDTPDAIFITKDGTRWISCSGDNRIRAFDDKGKLIREIGSFGREPGHFDQPAGLVVDSKGRLIVADSDNRRIQILTQEGKVLGEIK